VDTFGITQKIGSVAQESAGPNMNNVVNEIVGSDDSDLDSDQLQLEPSSDEDMAMQIKQKLRNAKMAFQPT
jgi:hypothetical protein